MRSIHQALVIAALAFAPLSGAAIAQDVGVTAAVNQSAQGTQPGSGIRTISLGDNVIYNERIETNDGGLVQILLADGTTFTVGPNSALVIDSFVYDPAAGTAQVAATLTKGVLRFIGGATSKTPDGVALTTPVGTVGIRGAVTDVNLGGGGDPAHIDLIFGSEVTLEQGQQLLGRLFQSGYSLTFGADGSVQVIKTPPEWTAEMAAALAGKPGTSGGSPNSPTNQQVADSGIDDENSEQTNPGDIPPPVLTAEEIEALLIAVANYEELRDFILDNQTKTYAGASGGIVHIENRDSAGNLTNDRWPSAITTGMTLETAALTSITLDYRGNPVAGVIDITTSPYSTCTACQVEINIDRDGATVTARDSLGFLQTADADAHLLRHDQVTLPSGVDYCECDFLDWGFWDVSTTVPDAGGASVEIDAKGAWVVGDITSGSDLATLGSQELANTYATFDGHAVGYASESGGPAYLAAGDLSMNWSFADREGYAQISDFDNRNFSGSIEGVGTQFFGGPLSDDSTGVGGIRGAFVNDGATPAAGVAGDFFLHDGSWNAAGIFAGERGPDGSNY